jgi:hypothetical protein
VETPDGAVQALAGGAGPSPVFVARDPVPYRVTFGVNGGSPIERSVIVPNWTPVAVNDSYDAAPAIARELDVLENDGVRRAGSTDPLSALERGDLPHKLRLCALVNGQAQCSDAAAVQTQGGGRASLDENGSLSYLISQAALAACSAAQGQAGCRDEFAYELMDEDEDRSLPAVVRVVASDLLRASDTQCENVLSGSSSFAVTPDIQGGVRPYTNLSFDANGGLAGTIAGQLPTLTFDPPSLVFTGLIERDYTVDDSGGAGARQSDAGKIAFGVYPRSPWTAAAGTFDPLQGSGVDILWPIQRARVDVLNVTQACTNCHFGSTPSGGLRLDGSSSDSFNCLTGAADVGGCVRRTDRLSTTNPAQSLLLTCPTMGGACRTPNSAHPKFFANVNDAEYLRILRWIQEGARFSASTDFRCP